MALRKNRFSRPATHHQRGHIPPLPHPSWRLGAVAPETGGAARITRAGDFWEKLGI